MIMKLVTHLSIFHFLFPIQRLSAKGSETAEQSHLQSFIFNYFFSLFHSTDMAGGYLCFVISIFSIGVVTAVIGDVASHFGCTLGIKDSVTAIVFVALGTSIPGNSLTDIEPHWTEESNAFSSTPLHSSTDTFASKVAAIQDKYADASVGNVTGSNAVNVFLGIGVAWTIAACYHAFHGRDFIVDPGKWVFLGWCTKKPTMTKSLISPLQFGIFGDNFLFRGSHSNYCLIDKKKKIHWWWIGRPG